MNKIEALKLTEKAMIVTVGAMNLSNDYDKSKSSEVNDSIVAALRIACVELSAALTETSRLLVYGEDPSFEDLMKSVERKTKTDDGEES